MMSSVPETFTNRIIMSGEEKMGLENTSTPGTELSDEYHTIHLTMAIALVVIGLLGAFGNGLVLYAFSRYKRLRSGGGPLILSLAAGDFAVSILHIMPAYSSFQERWAFGELGCELYAGAVGLGGLASLLTLATIAADRFSVIFGKPVSWLARRKTCGCIWALAFLLVLPPFLGWSKYGLEGVGTSCSWDYTTRSLQNRLYYIFLLCFGFLVPVTVIGISYYGILRVVYSHSRIMTGMTRNGAVVSKQTPTKTDLKTAKVILTIILCFLIAWTPYTMVSFIGQFGDPSWLTPIHTALPAIFAKSSVIYNPVVYGLSHPHFRSALRSMFFRNGSSHGNYPNETPTNPKPQHYHTSQQPSCQHQMMMGSLTNGRRTSRPTPTPQIIGGQRRVLRTRGPHGIFRETTCNTTTEPTLLRTTDESSQHEPRNQLETAGSSIFVLRKQSHDSAVGKRKQAPVELYTSRRLRGSLITERLTNYSEPDLHRCGERIERNYRRKKQSFLRKALFRSENCLDQLLQAETSKKVAVHRKHVCPHHYPSIGEQYLPSRYAKKMSHGESELSPRSSTTRKTCSCGRRSSEAVPEKLSPIHIPVHLPIRLHGAPGSSTNSSRSDCNEGELLTETPERRRSSGSSRSRRSSGSGRRKSYNIHLSSDNVGRGPKTSVSFVPDTFSQGSPRQDDALASRKASGNSEFGQYYESCRSSQSYGVGGSKKSSFQSCMSGSMMAQDKHQLKYSLIHRRCCCECSAKHSGE